MSEVLLVISGEPVYIESSEHLYWMGEFTVDGDGSPRCYGPKGCSPEPLDYLGNAGSKGNWWGVATDTGESDGDPIVQKKSDPYPGLYVSTTAYVNSSYYYSDPRHYVDSEKVPFIVIPGNVRNACQGVCKGCRATMTDLKTGKVIECLVADIGPTNHMGEASIACAKFFKIDPSPKSGGSSDEGRWRYDCWPGVAAEGYVLQS